MYKKIMLAYDGSLEGRVALREGALLAKQCGAQIFLLAVVPRLPITDAMSTPVYQPEVHAEILREGAARAKELGLSVVAELVHGDPAEEISSHAKRIAADLVVVSHRKRSFLERWWSGPRQGYLIDQLDCSILVARNPIGDKVSPAASDTGDD